MRRVNKEGEFFQCTQTNKLNPAYNIEQLTASSAAIIKSAKD